MVCSPFGSHVAERMLEALGRGLDAYGEDAAKIEQVCPPALAFFYCHWVGSSPQAPATFLGQHRCFKLKTSPCFLSREKHAVTSCLAY